MKTKLWISPDLELGHAVNGWPVEAFPADKDEADFERKRYAYELAKAKKDSIPVVMGKYSGDPFDKEMNPDTFIEFNGEVTVGWQFGGRGEIWQDGTEDHCMAMENKGFAIRQVSRLKPNDEEITDDNGIPLSSGSMSFTEAHGIAPINPHVAIGWTLSPATGLELIENIGLKEKILEAFDKKMFKGDLADSRHRDAMMRLSQTLDELGIK